MFTRLYFVCALFLAVTTASLIPVAGEDNSGKLTVGDPLPSFVLDDAYGNHYDLKAARGSYVFLLFGNRRMKDDNRRWAMALKGNYGARPDVRIFMVADMRGIPFFITKNFVREQIRKENDPVPLLLDWDQEVNNRLGIGPERIHILTCDTSGNLIMLRTYGGFSEADLGELRKELDTILHPAGPPTAH